ncbi:Guanylate-binding protein 4 [Anabarilius grahami]|uniref:Guanylate-binding protein 4 n=1 Tax=Anabarilius grahami TaxID=495550 RepID=A0A3N0Y1V5_ANAGA|nr:Guanylate-binding protein 4 [Anabarilius grahami]
MGLAANTGEGVEAVDVEAAAVLNDEDGGCERRWRQMTGTLTHRQDGTRGVMETMEMMETMETEENEKNALLEQKCKEEKEKRIENERMWVAEKERLEDQMKLMKEKFKQEMEQQQQEMDRAIESKLKEREELLNKGFREKADLLYEEINNLKKEKEEKEKSSGFFMKEYVMPIVGAVKDILPTILQYKVLMKGLKK